MITDLFSHKIHSSGDEWPEKLSELAEIFAEFDGTLYSRAAFEECLARVSPRASYAARDRSKFRDEFSAYPAYFGLYFLVQSQAGWIVTMTETAKRFLICEEPNVAAFLRLQLPLLQYPNAMGAAYYSKPKNALRIQENACVRTLDFIQHGVNLSPFRLIAVALKADAAIQARGILEAFVTYDEIFGLANLQPINSRALPALEDVAVALDHIRHGSRGSIPENYESRFHTLRHTEMLVVEHGTVRLREGANEADRAQLLRQIEAISSIESRFAGFDDCTSCEDIKRVTASGAWGQYFDAVRTLSSSVVEALTNDRALEVSMPLHAISTGEPAIIPRPVAEIHPFRERTDSLPPVGQYNRRREMADPELTRIKMQRRNLTHKSLIHKMDSWLRHLGATPKENNHIDLFAKIPDDGSFIFEMKSGGESILEQIRKGLSQLYEYRYRYRAAIGEADISLCLVLPGPPTLQWVEDYLVNDRNINICWFEEGGRLAWPHVCTKRMAVLVDSSDSAYLS